MNRGGGALGCHSYKKRFMKKLLAFIFLLQFSQLFAQNTPPLERIISIKITNERLDNALKAIGNSGSFSFSYNPDDIDINKKVSVSLQNQPVREALTIIFGNTVTFKSRGNYVILKKNDEEQKKDFFVMGYVSDGETGLKIEKASVYEPVTLASAVTNQYGYYRLKIPTTLSNVNIQVRKQNYHSTEALVKGKQNITLNLTIIPVKPLQISNKTLTPIAIKTDTLPAKKLDSIPPFQNKPIEIAKDTLSVTKKKLDYQNYWDETKEILLDTHRQITDWFINTRQKIHLNNIEDTLYRPFQISLTPFVGTNHYLSGNVINDYSVNILVGYSLGVRKLEVGGFMNIVRGNVSGIQAAGFANLVGEHVRGVQGAGFVNVVGKNTYGIQASGFGNLVFGNFTGIQASGFANAVLHSSKYIVQASGFGNLILNNGSGIQATGFVNLVGKDFRGIQASGFLNYVGEDFTGVQAGVINIADNVNKGLQIGVLNFADRSNAIPIGVASFVRKGGYKRLELSTDEVNSANLTFKTGVKRFYNVFTAGFNYNPVNKPLFSFGYGLGTAWRLNRTFWLNFDVVSHHLQNDVNTWELNQLTRGSLGLEVHLSPRIALFVASTVNFHATQETEMNLGKLSKFRFYEHQGRYFGERALLSAWWGYQGGIRICSR